jgi:hypothetical protein
MPVTINGDGSITGLAVGGLPDGSVDADTLASNAVTTNKIANSAVASSKLASGAIGSVGKILQVKSASKVDVYGVPGNANGATDVPGLSVTMDAPASSSSKYLVMASVAAVSNFVGASILLNGTTTGQLLTGSNAASGGTNGMSPDLTRTTSNSAADGRQMSQFPLIVLDSPNTSAIQTYKVQLYIRYVFQSGYNAYVNRPNAMVTGSAGSQTGGHTNAVSTITVMEIAV